MEPLEPLTPPYAIIQRGGLFSPADANGRNLAKEKDGCAFMWSDPEGAETFAERQGILDAGIAVLPWTPERGAMRLEDEPVLELLERHDGLTVEEAEIKLGVVPLPAAFRRLAVSGRIRAYGPRRPNLDGRHAVFWHT